MRDSSLIASQTEKEDTSSSYAYSVVHSFEAQKGMDQRKRLDDGGLRAGLELVGQAALAAVLAVLVEGHLYNGQSVYGS